ncbi:uncharacterized protein C8R40DRAFT_32 [Lentinula edodes]|uniref:uncharacterized protein n=1 Tax=Lentinula edodes TaxID=5353 RepID=UPI001E8ED0CA|nr:uncharacterized protein C8R40DRAFT_32 [Lentinula edodes]KAH7880848.1 hypothetical protein C8R40DRAFT_32 [Lentinula edodes]
MSPSTRRLSRPKILRRIPPRNRSFPLEPKLPPELFNLILDYLQFSLPTLKVCCLVARSWNARCQPYLFRVVNLDVWSLPPVALQIRKRSFIRRLEGLSRKSHLVQFTQRMWIETTSSRVGNKVTPKFIYQILTNIPMFTNLHTLVLNVPWNFRWGNSSEWPSKTLGSSLSNLIRQNPNLNSLSLSNPIFSSLDDLLAIVGFYSLNLEHLTIENVQSIPEEMRETTSDEFRLWMEEIVAHREPHHFHLSMLGLGYMHPRIRNEILMYPGFIDWKEVKHLNLSWDRHHASSCSTLLYCCLHHNLETLILSIVCCTDIFALDIQRNQLPKLKFLRIFSESVGAITTVLEQIIPASPRLLGQIEVVLDWAVPGVKKIHNSRTTSPVVSQLDPLLAHWMQSQYEYFRFVHVDIYMFYRKFSLKELQKLFQVLLPESFRIPGFHFGQCHGGFHYNNQCRGTTSFY